MIICSHSNIDIIQGVIGYGDAEGITDWRISNTITNANTAILNILNSTSANVRVSILENGNVGIGTTNPASILDIVGDANISGVYKKNNRDVINDTSNYVLSESNILVPRILTEVGNGSNYISRLNTELNTRVDNTSNYVLSINNQFANSASSQWTNVSSGIHYNTSNVGIGTTNPISKLHIYNDTISDTKLTIQNKFISPTGMIVEGTTSTTIGNTNRIIMFPYSGTGNTKDYTFTTTQALDCDILIVGGGGGGGAGHGGGGGAGQLILIYQATLNGTYTIKVGKGGNGAIVVFGGSLTSAATKGIDSEFGNATINAIAEGGGANGGSTLKDGGSGAGGDGYTADSGVVGKGLKNTTIDTFSSGTVYSRGNDGGAGGSAGGGQGGGGGGAGAAGTNGADSYNTTIGHGGDGLSGISAISYDFKTNFGNFGKLEADGNYWFAGGGAGGIYYTTAGVVSNGGKGGGGSTPPNINGAAQTGGNGINGTGGGGAGGSANYGSGGNGGSGIVIIKIKNIIPTSSTIDLIRGVSGDSNTDYSITNYEGDFKIISSTSSVNTDYIKITSFGASIYNPTGSPQWSTVSDRRIKENIEKASYDKCYDNINKLELYRFNYIKELKNINKDLKQLGYIAQEVQDIFPKAVSVQEFHNDNLSIPDMLSIDIAQINYSLYGTVKKLIEIDNDKELRIKNIENLLNSSNVVDTSNNVIIGSYVNNASNNII